MINILLVDDHKLFREGLKLLIDREKTMKVIAEADNGQDAIEMAGQLRPDIIIMDVRMPEIGGMEATSTISKKYPGIKIVALSMHSDKRFIKGMLKAGALGYMLKDNAFEEVIDCVNSVSNGKLHLCSKITEILALDFASVASSDNLEAEQLLSPRETEILKLIAEGRATKQIASDLKVSTKTVETHRRRLMSKLKIYNIADLTKYAITEGLIQLTIK